MAAVIAPNHTYESIESTLILLFQIPYDWPQRNRSFRGPTHCVHPSAIVWPQHPQKIISILLKNLMNASTGLSMSGKSPMISSTPPFVLRLSKDERGVFSRINFLFRLGLQ
jgi:hypothetical protein